MEQLREAVIEPLVSGLAGQVYQGAGLWDPSLNAETPSDHYGNTSASLAFALAGEEYQEASSVTLGAWFSTDEARIGHLPFNRLMLLLHQQVKGKGIQVSEVGDLRQGLARCVLRRSYPSNNWTLLAQCCRVIAAEPGVTRARQVERYCRTLDYWSTRGGGFIDFPSRPRRSRVATPIAYHHKALFLTVLVGWYYDSHQVASRLRRMLSWMFLTWDGHGYAGGLGRSTHSLFGDACLLAAITLLLPGLKSNVSLAVRRIEQGILKRMAGQFRGDGLLELNPAGGDVGVDGYMYLSVYNAWAAAIMAWALWQVGRGEPPQSFQSISLSSHSDGLHQDQEAGIARIQTRGGMVALLSTSGQPPQSFSRSFAELRYSGGIPLQVCCAGQPCVAPPVRVPTAALRENPALAGWTPILDIDGMLYGFTDYRIVEAVDSSEGIVVRLVGHPSALVPRGNGATVARLYTAIDWRFLGGMLRQKNALRRCINDAIRADVTFVFPHDQNSVSMALTLRLQGSNTAINVTYLNPGGHGLLSRRMPVATNLCIDTGSQQADWAKCDSNWLSTAMPSSLPKAIGLCKPQMQLRPGWYRYELKCVW